MDIVDFHSQWSSLKRYALAIGIFLIALALRFLILPIESELPFITFFPATILVFYFCGNGPGWLATLLSALAAIYFFLPPSFQWVIDRDGIIAVVLFISAAYLINLLIKQLKSTILALKSSEQRYLAILEDQTEFLCRFQADGTILYVNDAFCRLFCRPRETLIGTKWHPIPLEEDIPLINQKLNSLSPANPVVTIENRFTAPGKGIRWGQFINRAIYDKEGNLFEMQAVGRDITELKLLEEQLATTARELQDLYDNAPCGYHSLSSEGTVLRMNATELAWLGYQRDEVLGKMHFTDVLTPSGKALFRQCFPQYLINNRIENLNFDLVAKDGSIKSINLSATAIKDAKGRFVMSRSVSYDLTAIREAEKAIRESENKFFKIFHHSPIGIGISRISDNCFIDVNDAFLDIYGYLREEIIGHTANELGLWNDLDYREQIVQLLMQQGSVKNIEIAYHRKSDKKVLTLLASLEPVEVAGEPCLLGMIIDITNRKAMELQLRKLATAMEQSSESLAITNVDAEVEYVNATFLRTSGYSLEEVMGQNLRFLQSGKTPNETYVKMWDALTHGQCWSGEFINKRKNGEEYVEFAKISPMQDANGAITHYVEVKEDITDRKRLGQELDQHRHHLEVLVASRTAELEAALVLADAGNQAKSAFLANMSHEIRTPMNAIVGLTYLLQKSQLTPEQTRKLQQINKSSQHLLAILNDILDLSKIEARQLHLEQIDFALEALFDHLRSLMIHQAQAKGITIEVDRDDVPHWMCGDVNRLRQALLNYVSNAIKFTEHGSIWLRAKLLEDSEAGLLVRFEVQDTGIGIAEDKLPLLFEAFSQVDVSTTRRYGGTGLGLAITRRLANLMGGTTGVESIPGQGSLFWFTARLQRGHDILPIDSNYELNEAESVLRQQHAGARILLVEDNVINREVALELLNAVGLSVDTAENGREAIDKVRNTTYQLILMDIYMPELDGLEATKVIRALSDREQLPILGSFNQKPGLYPATSVSLAIRGLQPKYRFLNQHDSVYNLLNIRRISSLVKFIIWGT